jgi:hypothetical protein
MAVKNKKTTAAGIIALVGAVCVVAVAFLSGGDVGEAITISLLPALTGLGFLGAGDGGL